MEDTNVERTSGAGRLTWLWATLAILSAGGLLVWLGATAEPTQLQVVEEEEEDPTIPTVEVGTFAESVEQYTGIEIRLRDLPVASRLGTRMFWTQVPAEEEGMTTPYLMLLDSTLVADSVEVEVGDEVTVVGRAFPVSDELLTQWVEVGVIEESERIEAEFATSYMEVSDVRSVSGGGDEDEDEDDG